jgi:hypothetical protein
MVMNLRPAQNADISWVAGVLVVLREGICSKDLDIYFFNKSVSYCVDMSVGDDGQHVNSA